MSAGVHEDIAQKFFSLIVDDCQAYLNDEMCWNVELHGSHPRLKGRALDIEDVRKIVREFYQTTQEANPQEP